MIRIFGLAVITTLLASGTRSMSAEEPLRSGCKDGASRQFDFWVGHWRVTEHGKPAGENRTQSACPCGPTTHWFSLWKCLMTFSGSSSRTVARKSLPDLPSIRPRK